MSKIWSTFQIILLVFCTYKLITTEDVVYAVFFVGVSLQIQLDFITEILKGNSDG